MAGLGLVWAGGMYFVARAYSLAPATVVAPFEYVTLPIGALWGFVLWRDIPTLATWLGAGLTLFSGLYTLYLDQQARARPAAPSPENNVPFRGR
ncbi:MAG: hypothetical protein KA764_12190 [Anaerolineales bacterium]|nr:hypothetical protein [Anaerolineales bacterium]